MFISSLCAAVFQALQTHLLRLATQYVLASILLVLVALPVILVTTAPPAFPRNEPILIPSGSSLTSASRILSEQDVVYSAWLLRGIFFMKGFSTIQSGTYFFSDRLNVFQVGARLYRGVTYDRAIRITIPEGSTVQDIARIVQKKIPAFNVDQFIATETASEGYLFPDTYFFAPTLSSTELGERMRANYTLHQTWLATSSAHSVERDAVILASLLEGEAKTKEDKEIIAGILLKRIAIGMRLQVDAPFGYERGLRGYVPTRSDQETKTPYNTYLRSGLPPTPINNPGYESLYAATHPTKTPYLYYLTGSDGHMYYAKTFDEHIANQKKYFR